TFARRDPAARRPPVSSPHHGAEQGEPGCGPGLAGGPRPRCPSSQLPIPRIGALQLGRPTLAFRPALPVSRPELIGVPRDWLSRWLTVRRGGPKSAACTRDGAALSS